MSAVMAEIPAPTRGSGAVSCCGGHRDRCLFGHAHSWATWYANGVLQRTRETYYCASCGGVCAADEDDAAPASTTAPQPGAAAGAATPVAQRLRDGWYPVECEHGYDGCPMCDAPAQGGEGSG